MMMLLSSYRAIKKGGELDGLKYSFKLQVIATAGPLGVVFTLIYSYLRTWLSYRG